MSVSLHDSQTNKNAIISATSGSGKSFMANELLLSYMSEGAQVWVIDAGKSYKKLCDVMKGDFLQFDEASRVCLNPFALIQDYREDEDSIVSLVQNMASASNQLDDFQIAGLKKILAREWDLHHNDMNLDGIAEACKQDEDRRIKDIGEQLFPFTSAGSYGRYFNGANTIDFQNDFTVLELDELNGRRHLRQVVLLQLIYQIQQQVFLGERSRKKIILIDEAWDLLKEGQIASFMESAYRKFRKYNGCCIIATQSINDLYTNPTGVAIAENSATKFLLGQNGEAIESIKATKRLAMSDGCYDLLKTVHTMAGVYSEIFIHSERGLGVGRLIVSEFQKILYSTTPEDVAAVQRYLDNGMSMYEAIQHVLSDRGLQNTVYQDIDTEPLEEEVRYLGTGFGSFEENSPEYRKKFLEDYQEKHPDQEIDLSEFEPQKKKQEAQTEEKTEKKDLKSMLVGYIDKFMLKLGYSKDSQSENKVSQGENSEFVLTTDQKQTEGERVQERK
jgi:conjugal transfer ATP-binding protein TraC